MPLLVGGSGGVVTLARVGSLVIILGVYHDGASRAPLRLNLAHALARQSMGERESLDLKLRIKNYRF